MLRKASMSDMAFLYRMYMDPANNPWLLYERMPEPAFRPVMGELIAAGFKYVYEAGGRPVGMFKLVPQLHRNSHIVYLGGVAVLPECSGMGHGSAMLRLGLDLAHGAGLRRVELTVATENLRAIRLYERLGFVKEGVLRDFSYLRSEGRYIDEQVMALIMR